MRHLGVDRKERDPANHLGNSKKVEGRQGDDWGSWRPGAQALMPKGWLACCRCPGGVRSPNSIWLAR